MPGKIRIGQLRCRFEKGTNASYPGFKNINVTSGSMNKLYTKDGRETTGKEFSPFFLGPVKDKVTGDVSKTFENFWQNNKAWPKYGHAVKKDGKWVVTDKWRAFRKKGFDDPVAHRRPLGIARGDTPAFGYYENEVMDYLTSRRRIYVPYYCMLASKTVAFKALVEMVKRGENVMILDFDGPPRRDKVTGEDLWPQGMEVSRKNIAMMLRNERFAFGHGYVVAWMLWLATRD